MRTFIIQMNHELVPFELNNLTAIRMDLVARCVNTAFWLDHDLRRDTVIYFSFSNGILVRMDGKIRGMNPDERNIASFFRHMQEGKRFPGISLNQRTFEELMQDFSKDNVYALDINGTAVGEIKLKADPVFILGDDIGITKEAKAEKISLGPKSYLTSHCITVLQNRMDVLGI